MSSRNSRFPSTTVGVSFARAWVAVRSRRNSAIRCFIVGRNALGGAGIHARFLVPIAARCRRSARGDENGELAVVRGCEFDVAVAAGVPPGAGPVDRAVDWIEVLARMGW